MSICFFRSLNEELANTVSSEKAIEVQLNNKFCEETHKKFKILSSVDKESLIYEVYFPMCLGISIVLAGLNYLQLIFKYMKMLQEIITDFIQYNLPLPRAFFQSLQKTQIKVNFCITQDYDVDDYHLSLILHFIIY